MNRLHRDPATGHITVVDDRVPEPVVDDPPSAADVDDEPGD